MKTSLSPSSKSAGNSVGRIATFLVGYAFVLLTIIAVALTADFGARTSVARESVEVAVVPSAVLPVVEAALAAGDPGKLAGVIQFDGAVPSFPPVVKKGDMAVKDAAVCAAGDVPNEELVVNPGNKGIANVFVYLAKLPDGVKPPKPGDAAVIFDQKGCQFLPHALIAPVDVQVLVQNGDNVLHNTHTNPLRNDGFNQSIGANDRKGVPLKYKKSERLPVKVVCDVHPWMKAYHLVVDHPYTAVTDADGKFEIPNLPAGKHEFVIWQEKAGYLDRKKVIEIKAGQTADVELKFGAAKFASFKGPDSKTIAVNPVP